LRHARKFCQLAIARVSAPITRSLSDYSLGEQASRQARALPLFSHFRLAFPDRNDDSEPTLAFGLDPRLSRLILAQFHPSPADPLVLRSANTQLRTLRGSAGAFEIREAAASLSTVGSS
jgi:hypothetical protein